MNTNNTITQEELNKSLSIIHQLRTYYSERIVGQQNLGVSLLTCLMANGHILLESVPGLAKTTKIGPVYANFVLLDEINRSSAKTQSAMLEAMQERQITIGGEIFKLPPIFIVIATQNPIEQEGTYALAEAQLDRFLLKEKVEYPTVDEEVEILNRLEKDVFSNNPSILQVEDITFLQEITKKVYVDDSIKKYIANIVLVILKIILTLL